MTRRRNRFHVADNAAWNPTNDLSLDTAAATAGERDFEWRRLSVDEVVAYGTATRDVARSDARRFRRETTCDDAMTTTRDVDNDETRDA